MPFTPLGSHAPTSVQKYKAEDLDSLAARIPVINPNFVSPKKSGSDHSNSGIPEEIRAVEYGQFLQLARISMGPKSRIIRERYVFGSVAYGEKGRCILISEDPSLLKEEFGVLSREDRINVESGGIEGKISLLSLDDFRPGTVDDEVEEWFEKSFVMYYRKEADLVWRPMMG